MRETNDVDATGGAEELRPVTGLSLSELREFWANSDRPALNAVLVRMVAPSDEVISPFGSYVS
ncbi:hypothetical protein Asp14428_44570 [Actinoplanes sp. NBRC 14428]|nr:hypothetical protein Asp14428_44570 [Actinoplanes sp. NBRC 14428]